jgi:CRISPR-associated protein Csd1
VILQALKEYYDRKVLDSNNDIAPEGFEKKELPFLIVINEDGDFINIEDTREIVGNKLVGKMFLLPRSFKRSGSKSYEKTFLLWDHIGYLLGLPTNDEKSAKQHQTWLKMLENFPQELTEDVGVNAIRQFYNRGEDKKAVAEPEIKECLKATSRNMSFCLVSDLTVPCRKAVHEHVKNNLNKLVSSNTEKSPEESNRTPKGGTCLITGDTGVVVRIHGQTPIDKDANSLVSFQKNSGYDSYGKEQGHNAPIIESTEFAYITALNTLLKSKSQRLLIGDASTVFWSEKQTSFESDFSSFFTEPEKDDPNLKTQKVRTLFKSVETGAYVENDGDTQFYILGLSPNKNRIAVRFWQAGAISEFAKRIKQYFEDFAIIKPPNELEYYSVWRILVNIADQDDSKNIPPNLAGEFMRSIFNGTPYPAALLQAAICRIRSDTKNRVKPVRAAVIKAYLNRYYRFYPNKSQKEVTMEQDIFQPSTGYQLGRLFAVFEKIQEEASHGINATIRERFYGAASGTPVTVFAQLLRLKNHHLAKLKNKGRVIFFEQLLGDIMGKITDFPSTLNLHEQGLFAIGYYHQRQAFFKKKNDEVSQGVRYK